MDSEFVEGCANIWMSCVLLSFNLFVAPVSGGCLCWNPHLIGLKWSFLCERASFCHLMVKLQLCYLVNLSLILFPALECDYENAPIQSEFLWDQHKNSFNVLCAYKRWFVEQSMLQICYCVLLKKLLWCVDEDLAVDRILLMADEFMERLDHSKGARKGRMNC